MKSRVLLTCPVDGRRMEFIAFKGNAWERARLREMVAAWGRGHRVCTVELPERSKPHRCGDCGLELLFGAECPFHPSSRRVLWTRELEDAYRVVADEVAAGTRSTVPAGAAGEAKHQAIRLAEVWGRVADQRAEASA